MEPPAVDAWLLDQVPRLDVPRRPDRSVQFPNPTVYPPPGFVRCDRLDLGNGDAAGYYWPIGLENGDPVWCETWHDEWSLQPVALSLTQYLVDQRDEDAEFAPEVARIEADLGEPLRLDHPRRSPARLIEAARVANAAGRIDDAEADLRAAIDLLPEFGDAHVKLANVLRRQRRVADALRHDLIAMGCPVCLTRDRESARRRVVAAPDDALIEASEDPLFLRRSELTFATGVKFNDDFLIYEEVIAAYYEQGDPVKGLRLRVLVGELMFSETTSFWERYAWSPEVHVTRLRDEIERFLPARSPVVTDTAEFG